MKKLLSLLLAMTLLLVTSCKDDEEVNSISTNEAAEVVAAAIGSNSGGAVVYIQTAVSASATATEARSASTNVEYELGKDTVTNAGTITSGASTIGSWNYTWNYKNVLTATLIDTSSATPVNVTSTFGYSGGVDLPRYSSSHSGNGNLVYTSLGTGTISATATPLSNYTVNAHWTMNGTFTRTGTHTAKLSSKQITHTTTITFDDCEVTTDGTRKIVSGTATVHITGSVPSKGDFEYNGTVTFGSGSTGTLNIDGKTYTINIESGEAS